MEGRTDQVDDGMYQLRGGTTPQRAANASREDALGFATFTLFINFSTYAPYSVAFFFLADQRDIVGFPNNANFDPSQCD